MIESITTSLVRRGKSDMTSYDAQHHRRDFRHAGGTRADGGGRSSIARRSISDVPDDQFQRGLIFGTEAVSAAASRDNWSAYVEFSVPLLEILELILAGRYDDYSDFGDTTNPKVALRWAPIDELAFRASWGTGFRAPSLAQIGLGPSQESQFFKDTYRVCDQGIDPASTACPRSTTPSYSPATRICNPEESETLQRRRRLAAERHVARVGRLLGHQAGGQDRRGALWLPLRPQFCNDQDSTVCARGAPVGGDTLGPLQTINSGFINIGEQIVQGVDLGA